MVLSIPYIWADAAGDLIDGVLFSPQSRRDYAYLATPSLVGLLPGALVVGGLLVRGRLERRATNLLDVGIVAVAVLILVAAFFGPAGYLLYFSVGRGVAVVAVVAGAIVLSRRSRAGDLRSPEVLLLLLAMVAFMALVQFPFGAPVYYVYVAPLVAVVVVALLGHGAHGRGVLPAVLLAAFVVYGAAFLDRSSLGDLGARPAPDVQTQILAGNASVRVDAREKRGYDRIVALLDEHARGAFVFAGPDLPHVYFLSGRENPTRSLFDFLDTSGSSRGEQLLETLRAKSVTAVAINRRPDLSDPLDPDTLRELARLYPNRQRVGEIDVRWR